MLFNIKDKCIYISIMEYKVIETKYVEKFRRVFQSFGYVENVDFFVFPKGDCIGVRFYANK
tara:strand:- start:186 stop:368 length:183 start_codon:yes stop_codon:yes gene_type:complete